jgi:hypothetical protein
MTTPVQWGHVAQHALTPYHVRNAALRAYAFAPRARGFRSFRRQGVGQVMSLMELSSPGIALYRHAFGQPPTEPAWPEPTPPPAYENGSEVATVGGVGLGLGVGVIAAIVALAVAINYQYGKAMAPNKQSESKWAWGNAIGGTIFPPFTLGMAVYKNYFLD